MNDNNWHLSKSINISIIIGLVGQIAVFSWWASSINAQVSNNTDNITKVQSKINGFDQLKTDVAVLKEGVKNIEQSVSRIERKMETKGN